MYAFSRMSVRLAAVVILGAVTLAPRIGVSLAAGQRPMQQSDFFAANSVEWFTGGHIAGESYAQGLAFDRNGGDGNISFNSLRLPGYATLSADAGIADDPNNAANCQVQLTITGDGKTLYSKAMQQGQLALHVIFSLVGHHAFVIMTQRMNNGQSCTSLFAGPTLTAGGTQPQPSAHATPTAQPTVVQPTLTLNASKPLAGGTVQALITGTPGVSVVLVVDYATGVQMVLGPAQPGPGGKLTLSWTIPSVVTGKAHVTLDSNGQVAQGSFSIG